MLKIISHFGQKNPEPVIDVLEINKFSDLNKMCVKNQSYGSYPVQKLLTY